MRGRAGEERGKEEEGEGRRGRGRGREEDTATCPAERLERGEGWPQGTQPWLRETDKVGKKGRPLMAAQGLGAPRACPGPVDGNSGKREAALMRRVERGEITLQGTPVPLRSNEKGPHIHSTSAASKLCLQGPGLWTPAGSRGTGQCGRSLGLRALP